MRDLPTTARAALLLLAGLSLAVGASAEHPVLFAGDPVPPGEAP